MRNLTLEDVRRRFEARTVQKIVALSDGASAQSLFNQATEIEMAVAEYGQAC